MVCLIIHISGPQTYSNSSEDHGACVCWVMGVMSCVCGMTGCLDLHGNILAVGATRDKVLRDAEETEVRAP